MRMEKPKHQDRSKLDTNRKPTEGWLPNKRHKQLLEHVWEHGFVTDKHIMWLEGIGWRRAKELFKPLFDNGYLHRPNPKTRARYEHMFYWLTKRGAKVVADRLGSELSELDWMRRPVWGQVDHDAYITDLKIILATACKQTEGFQFADWINETTFRSWKDKVQYTTIAGNKGTREVVVDGYALIVREQPGEERKFYSRLLLEVELSHKANPRFAEHKALPLMAYLRSDIYYKRFDSKSGRFLFIVPTEEKMENYRRAVRRVIDKSDYTVFYFTTYEQVSNENVLFGKIWLRPQDTEPVSLF